MKEFDSPQPQIRSLIHNSGDCPNEHSPYNCDCEYHKSVAQKIKDGITDEFFDLSEKRHGFILSKEERMKLKETISISLMLEYIEAHK